MYAAYALSKGLKVEAVGKESGHITFLVNGRGAGAAFEGEAGSHCVQRATSGRRHTSFVTVAVLPLPPEDRFEPLPEKELEVKTQTGRQGAGGMNVNSVHSAVRMRHIPTGLSVFINSRDQIQNRKEALRVLTAKVHTARNGDSRQKYADMKSAQLANRGRGGKLRTYNFILSRVTDHRTGRETSDIKGVMKGKLESVR